MTAKIGTESVTDGRAVERYFCQPPSCRSRMHIYSPDSLPGYSPIATAIIRKDGFLQEHLRQAQSGQRTAKRRPDAVRAIRESMKSLTLHPAQTDALTLFADGAACIVTGQQVGFLGGPMYTVTKIATVVSRVRHRRLTGTPAVGVFWVEDNDHDLDEASRATLFHKDHGSIVVSAREYSATIERQSVASCTFDERVSNLGANIAGLLHEEAGTGHQVEELLRSTYVAGRSWADAFLHLLNGWFAAEGVLFIKASTVRKMGLMSEILGQDLREPGWTAGFVESATRKLTNAGYHAQISPSPFNVFHHDEQDRRHKIHVQDTDSGTARIGERSLTVAELSAALESTPERFSPSVVLRPLVQDHVLESSEMVAGPGELAYLCQLTELYVRYGVPMPVLIPRSGATFVSHRIERLLRKEQRDAMTFLRPWEDIERETTVEARDADLMSTIRKGNQEMELLAGELLRYVESFDKSLSGAVLAMRKAMEKELATLERKVSSAARRKQEEQLKRLREIHFFIFPEERLQERSFVPIRLMRVTRESAIGWIIDVIGNHPDGHHFLINESAYGKQQS